MKRDSHFDTIIIGAGVAGLTAAAELTRKKRRVLVLEARDRVGGRIFTHRDPALSTPVELGAEFIHGTPDEIWDIVHSAALRVVDVTGEHWQHNTAGKLKKVDDLWADIERVMGKLDASKRDQSFREFLKTTAARTPARIRKLVTAYVEGFNAADADRIGTKSLAAASAAEEEEHGDRLFRFIDGYDRVVEHLREQINSRYCETRLRSPVVAMRWKRNHVEVETRAGRSVVARSCLITIPLGVLRQPPGTPGAIAFDPPLPEAKRDAIHQLAMGAVTRSVLQFDNAFWETKERLQVGFIHAASRNFPTWWTLLPMRVPLLVAWSGGPATERMSGLSDDAMRAAAIESLAAALNVPLQTVARHLKAIHRHDWRIDPYARGAYSYIPVGAINAPKALAKPVDRTLFFAGEATAEGQTGTVHAAIASGRRAARELTRGG